MNGELCSKIRMTLADFEKLHKLRGIVNRENTGGSYYICNHHLGDTAIFCSMAKSIRNIKDIKITVVVEQRYQSIPKIFGLESLIVDIPKYKGNLEQTLYWIYLSLTNIFSKSKLLLSFSGFFDYIRRTRKIIYSDMYIRFMLSLDSHIEIPLSCIDSNFTTSPTEIKTEFLKYGLKIGRTVIISPESLSSKEIDRTFFIALYQELEKVNYTPVINSSNKFWIENNFRNFFPDPMIFLHYAIISGYSVTARNGISDLLSFTPGVKNIIIYSIDVSKDFIIGRTKEKLCTEIEEYFYAESSREELVQKIIDSINISR